MKIIYNRILPFRGFAAINLFGLIFARKEAWPLTPTQMRHERIHTAQMRELLYIGFYLAYFFEWLFRLVRQQYTGENAYRNISFEKEAFGKQNKVTYLDYRKPYAQWRRKEKVTQPHRNR